MGVNKIVDTLLFGGVNLLSSGEDKPESAESLDRKAGKKAQEDARRRAKNIERGGKTIFTSPVGTTIPPNLKKDLGS